MGSFQSKPALPSVIITLEGIAIIYFVWTNQRLTQQLSLVQQDNDQLTLRLTQTAAEAEAEEDKRKNDILLKVHDFEKMMSEVKEAMKLRDDHLKLLTQYVEYKSKKKAKIVMLRGTITLLEKELEEYRKKEAEAKNNHPPLLLPPPLPPTLLTEEPKQTTSPINSKQTTPPINPKETTPPINPKETTPPINPKETTSPITPTSTVTHTLSPKPRTPRTVTSTNQNQPPPPQAKKEPTRHHNPPQTHPDSSKESSEDDSDTDKDSSDTSSDCKGNERFIPPRKYPTPKFNPLTSTKSDSVHWTQPTIPHPPSLSPSKPSKPSTASTQSWAVFKKTHHSCPYFDHQKATIMKQLEAYANTPEYINKSSKIKKEDYVHILMHNLRITFYSDCFGENAPTLIENIGDVIKREGRSIDTVLIFNMRAFALYLKQFNRKRDPNRLDDLLQPENPTNLFIERERLTKDSNTMLKAVFQESKRQVVIKIFDLNDEELSMEYLRNEITIMNLLRLHPNITHLYGAYKHKEDTIWLVMESMHCSLMSVVSSIFGDGESKPAFPGMDGMGEPDMARVVLEILKGLRAMHNLRYVHRDVKSENVLVSVVGAIKLADFGFAVQLTKQKPKRSSTVGSPYWMAPELIARQEYGAEVDIWSLGVLLMELMEGDPPYLNDDSIDTEKVSTIILEVGLPPPKNKDKWSLELLSFLDSCLTRDTQYRPNSNSLLLHPFLQKASPKEEICKLLTTLKIA